MAKNKEITIWSADSIPYKEYKVSTYLRVMKVQEFVEKVQKKHKIVGITFEDNLLGFILDKKEI